MPKISVIVPVYKVEDYLHRCVDSILNQSFSDFELILVDDGSPDNCGAICDEYAQKDSRVYVIHQQNAGVSAARNRGLDWADAHSDSCWIAFIDSDDWIHRDYLKILLTAAEESDASIAVCGLLWTDRMAADAQYGDLVPMVLDAETTYALHCEKMTGPCAKLYEKALWENVRFPANKRSEDAFVTHIPLFRSEKVAVFEEKLYYYYNHSDSFTRTKWSQQKLDLLEAHELRLAFLREGGYDWALRRQKEIYAEEIMNLITHLLDVRESDRDELDTLEMLRQKLRELLKAAREDGCVPFNRENLWAYLYAMKRDWLWKSARGLQKAYRKIKYR